MPGSFRVTLRKSPISYTARARGTLRALGLHRLGQTVEVVDNPQTRGMARAVRFLVEVEEREGAAAPVATPKAAEETKPARSRAPGRSRTDEAS